MHRIVFDTNIFRYLDAEAEVETRENLRALITHGRAEVLLSPVIRDELQKSPLGIPPWLPLTPTTDSVWVLGTSRLGEIRPGSGEVYKKHLGTSQKTADARIADLGATDATVFVSNDDRCRNHLAALNPACRVFTLREFGVWVRQEVLVG